MAEKNFVGYQSRHVDSFTPDHGWLAEVRWKDGSTTHVPLIGWAIVQTSIQPVLLLDHRSPAVPGTLEEMGAELVRLTDRKTDYGWQ